jgi:hypothetical protein
VVSCHLCEVASYPAVAYLFMLGLLFTLILTIMRRVIDFAGGRGRGDCHVHVVESKSRLRARAVLDKDADDISSQANEVCGFYSSSQNCKS